MRTAAKATPRKRYDTAESTVWLRTREAADALHVNRHAVPRLAAKYGIRRLDLDRTTPRWNAEDIRRAIASATTTPTATAAG